MARPVIEPDRQLTRKGRRERSGGSRLRKGKRGRIIKGGKRHPTIKDNVTIYAEATILGGEVVIGENSVIGGNVWLTESVPPGTTVTIAKPELVYRKAAGRKAKRPRGGRAAALEAKGK